MANKIDINKVFMGLENGSLVFTRVFKYKYKLFILYRR